tara:strand:- start:2610 stop:2930 length:321 start_codon:yes stop_codon:yes gene_type:complete
MSERECVNRLREWIESLSDINYYRDKYDNVCYGNSKQKHIVHLHAYNLHADIEVNDSNKFKEYLDKHELRPHEWNPDKWLIVDVDDWKKYEIAKEIIYDVYDNERT